MDLLVGSLSFFPILCGCLWVAHRVGSRMAGPASVSARLAAAAIVAQWLLVAGFHFLSALGAFRPAAALAFWTVAVLCATPLTGGYRRGWQDLREDLLGAARALGELGRGPVAWVAAPALLMLGAALARGLAAPPLGWDGLVYHLFQAGRWVQEGGRVIEAAPDTWGFHEYFSPYGAVLWAWTLLPCGDAFLPLGSLLVWLGVLLSAYTACRQMGAERPGAALGSLAIAFLPPVFQYLTSGYVDSTALALILLGAAFLARSLGRGGPWDCALSMGALALAAGTRLSAVPFLALALPLVAVRLWRERGALRLKAAAACGLAVLIAVPPYLDAWIGKGSPVYPFEVRLLGRTILEGHPLLTAILSGATSPGKEDSPAAFLGALLWPGGSWLDYQNFSPFALLVLPGALAALWRLGKRRDTRLPAAYLAACGALLLAGLFGDGMRGQRVSFADSAGRLAAPGLAAAIVLASTREGPLGRALLLSLLVSQLCLEIPACSKLFDVPGAPEAARGLLVLLILGGIAARLSVRFRRPLVPAAILLGACALFMIELGDLRKAHRYQAYREAARGEVREPSLLDPRWASLWPIWERLDRPEPRRIAITAGWNGAHTWYRYPLLGSRLQNRVFYVPPTGDGRVPDRRGGPGVVTVLSFERWVERLLDRRVEEVLAFPAHTVEGSWMQSHPELFTQAAATRDGAAAVFRFHPQKAAEVAARERQSRSR